MGALQELVIAARRAHPAFRFATAVAGVIAFVVLFSSFGVRAATIVLGGVIFIGLMVLFVLFARLSRLPDTELTLPARTALWSVVLLAVASLVLLFWSTFFDSPLPIRSYLVGHTKTSTAVPGQPEVRYIDRVRVALVVANAAYDVSPLRGPAKEVDLIVRSLKACGFQVTALKDASKKDILEGWKTVETVSTYGGIALLYYSGHGARQAGDDFIIPVDADGPTDYLSVASLMQRVSGANEAAGASGELILYSTAAGSPAIDLGHGLQISPFAAAFVGAVDSTSGDIHAVFDRVSVETRRMTNNEQTPWISGSFTGSFSLRDRSYDQNIGILRLIIYDAARM